jgi:metal-sulfur cluster biosynthetic enzyme
MTGAGPPLDPLRQALTAVIDPEIGLDIVTLGLVYEADIADEVARIAYTLTTPGCPMERLITDGIRAAAAGVPGVSVVETRLVWDPAWHPGMIEAEGL